MPVRKISWDISKLTIKLTWTMNFGVLLVSLHRMIRNIGIPMVRKTMEMVQQMNDSVLRTFLCNVSIWMTLGDTSKAKLVR